MQKIGREVGCEGEGPLTRSAKVDDPATYQFLRTVPGIGPILGLVMLFEIGSIQRFPGVGNFLSYARLVGSAEGRRAIGGAQRWWYKCRTQAAFIRDSPR